MIFLPTQPILVSNVHKQLDDNLWHPNFFNKHFGHLENDLVDCRSGDVITGAPMRDFWNGFEDISSKLQKTCCYISFMSMWSLQGIQCMFANISHDIYFHVQTQMHIFITYFVLANCVIGISRIYQYDFTFCECIGFTIHFNNDRIHVYLKFLLQRIYLIFNSINDFKMALNSILYCDTAIFFML